MRFDRRTILASAALAAPSVLLSRLGLAASPGGAEPIAPWPHVVSANGASVTIYEPQAISWPGHTVLTARAAIQIQPAGKPPFLGTIEVSGTTTVDTGAGVVYFSQPKLLNSSFPSLDTTAAYQVQQRIGAYLAKMPPKIIPLDTVLLSLGQKPPAAAPVNNAPPTIFYSAQPASLVVFDGAPVMAPIGNTGLSYAVNTNWDVLQDAGNGGAWYLLNNGSWLVAQSYTGPYQPAGPLPAAFSHIPNDANFGHIRQSVPGKPLPGGSVPIIFVSTKPAEIIVTAGPPQFRAVPSTSLEAVINTGAVLFRYTPSNSFYYLVSGRWFSAASLYGPWTFATPNLPADFARLSPDGEYGNLLASVPGTAAAQAAVLKAQVPTQGTLSRSTAKVSVTYAGAPHFAPIPGTSLQYATNTAYQVILTGGRYYCCFQGAWFVASSPTGPWALAAAVPPAIYTIPATSPLYNVTYVQVYSATPTAVTYGYTAGYLMGFVTAGVLAYGTGYYYPPYVAYGHVPVYYPYPYTYAGNVHYNTATGAWARTGTVYGPYGRTATAGYGYNPTTGAYTRGAAVYGPYGGAGTASRYNPTTGTYAHGSAAWNSYGGTAHAEAYNPYTGRAGETTQNANAYGRWGSSTVSGPNGTAHTASASNAYGSAGAFHTSNGAAGAGVHTASGNNAAVVRTPTGNVYAGADGNAYQHTSSGWSKWSNGSWQQAQHPTSQSAAAAHPSYQRPASPNTYSQLNQDRTARQYGGYNRGAWGGGGGGVRRRW
ncbi:hypothetical protein [Acidisoma sp. C75]